MQQTLFAAILFTTILLASDHESGAATDTFVDGRWSGGIETGPGDAGDRECWARTTFRDGTTLSLAVGESHIWYLRLSNTAWQLPPSHKYEMEALVDFYPRHRITAKATHPTLLEIANLEQGSLLGNIENGHTIDLFSDGFNAKYELEGSAKIIERLRICLTGI